MTLMKERYTGVVFDVCEEKVEERLSKGYVLLESTPAKRKTEKREEEARPAPVEKPSEESTIAEIRAYAKAKGVKLKSRSKEGMLEELEEV